MTDRDTRQILLTPGPLTTSDTVRRAMLHDWGSRSPAFIEMTARIRDRLTALAGGADSHVCVPVQGSGTFAVEATLGTLVPRDGKVLVLSNGAYCRRMVRILEIIGRACETCETAEDTPPDPAEVARRLNADPAITHVAAVHCETTSGILNPVEEIAAAVAQAGRALILDSMSGFGALPLDLAATPCQAVIASANKCLEGVPGLGFALIEKGALAAAQGNAHALSLDLHDQWITMERTGQWRFTPPTHVIAALDRALDELDAEGGVPARGARYRRNCDVLRAGLREMGFALFLGDNLQAPVIVTVRMPRDPKFDFDRMYRRLFERGVVLYPGAVTQEKSFRVGCIGRIDETDIRRALHEIAEAVAVMGVDRAGLTPAERAG
jgi:2-aminoethylphosphonate-pyruvate transaminase